MLIDFLKIRNETLSIKNTRQASNSEKVSQSMGIEGKPRRKCRYLNKPRCNDKEYSPRDI
jgi:hypothetical protein